MQGERPETPPPFPERPRRRSVRNAFAAAGKPDGILCRFLPRSADFSGASALPHPHTLFRKEGVMAQDLVVRNVAGRYPLRGVLRGSNVVATVEEVARVYKIRLD